MPRKKAESQPLGELLGLRMPKEDQAATLKTLDSLPDIFYALLCHTQDQTQAFRELKEGYQYIKADIKALFAGEGEVAHALAPDQRDFWGLMSDRYLAWYMVVHRGWQYLQDEWESDERLAHFQVETPGAALIQLLETECQGFMEPAFSERYRFAPSQHRKWAKDSVEIAHGKANSKTEKAMQAARTVKGRHLQAFTFGGLCLEICRANAKKNERLQLALRHHDAVIGALDTTIRKKLHPRKAMKGYEWRNGTKYKINRYGPSDERFYS
jgi:hypothetical protein